ncbi:aldehyde dehydrogenase family protein [Immundisolibacter sp.]|uniref:aldehyde dehydrogenase family protein n=1 Tax=Immundisolibacter sp. TaxID=1934948 RepID=UPI00356773F2
MNAINELPASRLNDELARVFALQQARKIELRETSVGQRLEKLMRLRAAVIAHKADIVAAAYADMRKPQVEALLGEIMPVTQAIDLARKNLRRWMRPQRVRTPINMLGTRGAVRFEPKGSTLIIAPWNVPVFLSFVPLTSAVAAGCTAMIKPSEMTPALAVVIRTIVAECFDEAEVAVFEGGPEVAQALLTLPFDHIFYTGNPEIGKVVMRAAAEHLTSVTLELGGKSPVIVDESADIESAAERLAWGKLLNGGQICVAPDYVLVHESRKDELLGALTRQMELHATAKDGKAPELTRIVNTRHHTRVQGLLDDALARGARVVTGGQSDAADCFIAPTVLTDVSPDSKLMHEEIFGPLLPVLSYRDLTQALELINAKPKPLALYAFSRIKANVERILRGTSSGGSTINHVMLHGLHPNLPFGGVNNSGIGKSGGFYGFQAFSNERAVLHQVSRISFTRWAMPPYSPRMIRILDRFVR